MDIKNMILNIFQYDLEQNNKHSSITQLCLLSIKSLLPVEDKLANRIDYKRFREELNLWQYYKVGNYNSLENILSDKIDETIYFQEDASIAFRTIPIAVGNIDIEVSESEVIKNILYTTGNLKSLFTGLIMNQILYLKDTDTLVEELKDYIINFGQTEFLQKYSKYYRDDIEKYPGNYKIEFEKEKIELINLLNGSESKHYSEVGEVLDLLLKGETSSGGLSSLFKTNLEEYNLNVFFINMNEYALKLRSGEIGREDLKISDYKLPDVFEFEEGDKFYHSLLNNCLVVKKEVRNNILTSVISTKTGNYRFQRSL